MMFSTRPGEALPVRTPANSFCTTCSVFCILSSASSRMSSIGIGNLEYQIGGRLYRGTQGPKTLLRFGNAGAPEARHGRRKPDQDNLEARLTNAETIPKSERRIEYLSGQLPPLRFANGGFLRHSSFVIRIFVIRISDAPWAGCRPIRVRPSASG